MNGVEITVDEGGAALRVLRSMEQQIRDGKPLLHVVVRPRAMRDVGDEPAELHRFLAEIGYVPELLDGDGSDEERWQFHHPDGTRP